MTEPAYLVAGCKPWNRQIFDEVLSKHPGRWSFVGAKEELTIEMVRALNPTYIFFLHWSWIVPDDLVSDFECVCFHMTDVPYGRGGSPLQNLIVRGHSNTKLTALRMTGVIDGGPVYFKEDLSLHGAAGEIFRRATLLSAQMIGRILHERPTPLPQTGEPVSFPRRKPQESLIPATPSPAKLYDFIRMLDAEGYPKAFFIHEGYRYEFSRASLDSSGVAAAVTITPIQETAP